MFEQFEDLEGKAGNGEQNGKISQQDPFEFLVNSMLAIEKRRVATQVRHTHLEKQGKEDPETTELLRRLLEFEEYLDNRIGALIESHPVWPWAERVKGVGRENLPKIVGFIDINEADKVSSLWKFAGFAVEDGKAPKATPGQKLDFNKQLRSMCWRLGKSLLRAKGVFYEYYLKEKEKYVTGYRNKGFQIIPAAELPTEKGKKYEPEGVISEGHVHNQATRKMIKLFLSCLWVAWREAVGLPVRNIYACLLYTSPSPRD